MSKPLPVASNSTAVRLDPKVYDRGLSCVHCGLCLPACPTYTQTGMEADSPRGRIQLMLGLHDGKISPTSTVREHLDLCLDCRGCETACPSNVVYHELIEETRAKLPPKRRTVGDQLVRLTFLHVLTRPFRLKLALLPARLLQRTGIYRLLRSARVFDRLPTGLRKMEAMLPDAGPIWPRHLPRTTFPASAGRPIRNSDRPADHGLGTRICRLESWAGVGRASVYFFPGCVGAVMSDELNRKAIQLLAAAGCAVTALPTPSCCGAIHHHNGLHEPAAEMARRIIDAVLPRHPRPQTGRAQPSPEPIAATAAVPMYFVTPVAGCGAMLRDFATLLRDDSAYAERAIEFVSRVRDVVELLAELGLPDMPHAVNLMVTYHDACHLVHAQKVAAQPRALLAKIRGLKIVPLAESDMCCGAAGTYNLTQPAMAGELADRKLANIEKTGTSVCLAGNVGCSMHLASAARAAGQAILIKHPVEILHQAVFGLAPDKS